MTYIPRHDVSHLPTTGFGPRSGPWWGTLGFMLAEGTTLALCAAAYLYLARRYPSWPPPGVALPELLLPTLSAALLVASLIPAMMLERVAKRRDGRAVARMLVLAVAVEIVLLSVRAFELGALDVRWDENSYGSIVWFILGIHTLLLATDLGETAIFAAIFLTGRVEEKHFPDAADVAFYWYFVVGSWIPLYLLLYLSPRIL